MSAFFYIASDHPLPEIQNPHGRWFSVNEALAAGVEVPGHLLNPGIDRDWKHAVYWTDRGVHFDLDRGTIDDGNFDDDFSILPFPPGLSREDIYTGKQYQAVIECIWTRGRAQAILAYLGALLETAEEVELWHIYIGSGEKPKIIHYEAHIDSFTADDLLEISDLPIYGKVPIHHRVTIAK